MDYLRGSFSVSAPGTKAYRDNFDKIDWGRPKATAKRTAAARRGAKAAGASRRK